MAIGRGGTAGKTRSCPHCRATILDSATICPACKHHLKFDPAAVRRARETIKAFHFEGAFRHPGVGAPREYSIVISVRNDEGEEIARQVVGVGSLTTGEGRSVTLDIEVLGPLDG